jgi:hypothetical protein
MLTVAGFGPQNHNPRPVSGATRRYEAIGGNSPASLLSSSQFQRAELRRSAASVKIELQRLDDPQQIREMRNCPR